MEGSRPLTKEDVPMIVSAFLHTSSPYQPGSSSTPQGNVHGLIGKFILVALELSTDINSLRKFTRELLQDDLSRSHYEVFCRVLEGWIGERGNLTLEELASVLTANGLHTFAVKLNSLFTAPFPSIAFERRTLQEKVFSNEVIIKKIFEKLPWEDKKAFRVTNQTIWGSTLPYWRRSAWITIVVISDGMPPTCYHVEIVKYIYMEDFIQLVTQGQVQSESEECSAGSDSSFNYRLLEHPFRHYRLNYNNIFANQYPLRANNIAVAEKPFWEIFGSKVTHLALDDVNVQDETYAYILGRLLLEICTELEELEVGFDVADFYDDDNDTDDSDKEKRIDWKKLEDLFAIGKFAKKLTTVNSSDNHHIAKLYRILPNLKNLSINNSDGFAFDELTKPTIKGNIIKLEKLTINENNERDTYQSLRKYTELVPNTLNYLELHYATITAIREEPLDLYAALAQCRWSLRTLKLTLHCEKESWKGDDIGNWFPDLSNIMFPNLKHFTLRTGLGYFSNDLHSTRPALKFDFGTIKSMPQLETLEIKQDEKLTNYCPKPITESWIFKDEYGMERQKYIPKGVALNYRFSENASIASNSLKKLTFECWPLSPADLRMISNWFPNITYLNLAVMDPNHLSDVISDEFENLETLFIQHQLRPVPLAELETLKRNRKNLQIIHEIKEVGTIEVKLGPRDNVSWIRRHSSVKKSNNY